MTLTNLFDTKGPFLESPEKPLVKLRPAYSVKLIFPYVVKGIKIKITAKFRASRCLHFEDTKRIMSPEMHPKSFRTFGKRAPDLKNLVSHNDMSGSNDLICCECRKMPKSRPNFSFSSLFR